MGRIERPELTGPPEFFYNDTEAAKYTSNSRILEIQAKLTYRAVELLALNPDEGSKLLLDIGCGSGLSGEVLADMGHQWVGMDISPSMINVAVDRGIEGGDVSLADMGHGLPYRDGSFDGAISISAVQWLCNADSTAQEPRRRIAAFFSSLYRCLSRGARAVLQIYPQDADQAQMLTAAAMRAGFTGGLVVDYPHSTRAKKCFLVLMVGSSSYVPQARGINGEDSDEEVQVAARASSKKKGKKVGVHKGKAWVFKKKEQRRARGDHTARDSKYTARRRKPKF